MVTTRSQTQTETKTTTTPSNEKTSASRKMLVEVMEDMLVDAQERAKAAERKLAVAESKVKMLEYELMQVRNEHVNELLDYEKASKNRQFYYLFWLLCTMLLQGVNVYYCLCK